MRSILLMLFLAATLAMAQAESPHRDLTIMSWSPGHGTQIEYFDRTSTWTYLWYPGNQIVLPGQTLTASGPGHPPSLCFRYGPQIHEPLTPDSGGWSCAPMEHHEGTIVDKARGDVFGLSKRRTVPFPLPRERTTIDALRKGGRSAARSPAPPAARKIPPEMTCQSILASAETSPQAMLSAGVLLYHGKHMGKRCVKIDYARAFDLIRRSGDARVYGSLLKDLKTKASTGNPRAVAALRRLEN